MSFEIHVSGAPKEAVERVVPTLIADLVASGITSGDASLWGPTAEGVLTRFGESQGKTLDEMKAQYEQGTALGYLPEAQEIAKVAVFLASELSNPVTGHLLDANAGQYM